MCLDLRKVFSAGLEARLYGRQDARRYNLDQP
jgi:hypothetical protein